MQHEKYLLVALRCSKWSARKFDPKATQEVVDTHHAASDVGRFNKMLLSKVYINPVHSAFAAARAQHDKLTLPWTDDGYRLLPSAKYLDYVEKMRPLLEAIDEKVAALISNYQDMIEERRSQINGLFDPADYPSEAQLREKFKHQTEVGPVPASDAIRFGDPHIERDLREHYEELTKARVEDAQREVWYRLLEPLKRLVVVLTSDGRIHESTYNAILAIARMVPQYNISGDPKLDAAAAGIYGLISNVSVDELRDSEVARAEVAGRAKNVIEEVERMQKNSAGAF